MAAEIKEVEEGADYYHVRFNDPDRFDKIRTPDWADKVSDSVSEGSEVRMGQMEDSDDWTAQAVLIKKSVGKEKSKEKANQIVEKINE